MKSHLVQNKRPPNSPGRPGFPATSWHEAPRLGFCIYQMGRLVPACLSGWWSLQWERAQYNGKILCFGVRLGFEANSIFPSRNCYSRQLTALLWASSNGDNITHIKELLSHGVMNNGLKAWHRIWFSIGTWHYTFHWVKDDIRRNRYHDLGYHWKRKTQLICDMPLMI